MAKKKAQDFGEWYSGKEDRRNAVDIAASSHASKTQKGQAQDFGEWYTEGATMPYSTLRFIANDAAANAQKKSDDSWLKNFAKNAAQTQAKAQAAADYANRTKGLENFGTALGQWATANANNLTSGKKASVKPQDMTKFAGMIVGPGKVSQQTSKYYPYNENNISKQIPDSGNGSVEKPGSKEQKYFSMNQEVPDNGGNVRYRTYYPYNENNWNVSIPDSGSEEKPKTRTYYPYNENNWNVSVPDGGDYEMARRRAALDAALSQFREYANRDSAKSAMGADGYFASRVSPNLQNWWYNYGQYKYGSWEEYLKSGNNSEYNNMLADLNSVTGNAVIDQILGYEPEVKEAPIVQEKPKHIQRFENMSSDEIKEKQKQFNDNLSADLETAKNLLNITFAGVRPEYSKEREDLGAKYGFDAYDIEALNVFIDRSERGVIYTDENGNETTWDGLYSNALSREKAAANAMPPEEQEYIRGLYGLSSEELEKKYREQDEATRTSDLNMARNLYYYTNPWMEYDDPEVLNARQTLADAYGIDPTDFDQLKDLIHELETYESGDVIYTDSQGKNYTYQDLYYNAGNREQFNRMRDDDGALELLTEAYKLQKQIDMYNSYIVDAGTAAEYMPVITGLRQSMNLIGERLGEKDFDMDRMIGYLNTEAAKQDFLLMSQASVEFTQEHPVLANLLSMVATPFQALEWVSNDTGSGNPEDLQNYVPMNYYGMDATNFNNAVRGTTSDMIRKEMTDAGFSDTFADLASDVYSGVLSAAQSRLLALACSAMVGPGTGELLTLIIMGSTAASETLREGIDRGLDNTHAILTAVSSGIAEAAFEEISLDKFLKNALDPEQIPKTILEALKKSQLQRLVEGSEEFFTDIANAISDGIINGNMSDYNTKLRAYQASGMTPGEAAKKANSEFIDQLMQSFFGGYIGGGGFGAFLTNRVVNSHTFQNATAPALDALNNYEQNRAYRAVGSSLIQNQNVPNIVAQAQQSGNVRLQDLANEVVQSPVYKQQTETKVQQSQMVKPSMEQQKSAPSETQETAVKPTKQQQKEYQKTVGKLATESVKEEAKQVFNGDQVALKEAIREELKAQHIKPEDYVVDVVAQVANGEKLSAYGENIAKSVDADRIVEAVKALAPDIEKAAGEISDAAYTRLRNVTSMANMDYTDRVSKTGQAVNTKTGENVYIDEISNIKVDDAGDITMTIRTKDGDIIDAADIQYANPTQAALYDAVAASGVNARIANGIVANFEGTGTTAANNYVSGMLEGMQYGRTFQTPDMVTSTDGFYADLTPAQKDLAIKYGKIAGNMDLGKAVQDIRNLKAANPAGERTGSVNFVTSKDVGLNNQQRTGVRMAEILTEYGKLNNNFNFFASQVKPGTNSTRVVDRETAKKLGLANPTNADYVSAPNGWYNQKTGDIYIDLNAGDNGEGTVLFTLGHEMTHFVKAWSPSKFNDLAKFLVNEYHGAGVNVDKLVRNQIDKAMRTGRTLSYDEAFEEMVADSMQTMFTDGNLAEKLIRLRQTDKSLFDKLYDFVKKLQTGINKVYKDMSPFKKDSDEFRALESIKGSIDKLSDAFAEGITEATGNYAASEFTWESDRESKLHARDAYDNIIVDEEVTPETVRDYLESIFASKRKPRPFTFPVRKTTPEIYKALPGMRGVRSLVMSSDKAWTAMKGDVYETSDNVPYTLKDRHALGVDGLMKIINRIDKPNEIIEEDGKNNDGHYAALFKDDEGNTVAAIEFEDYRYKDGAMVNDEEGFYDSLITVFNKLDENTIKLFESFEDYIDQLVENAKRTYDQDWIDEHTKKEDSDSTASTGETPGSESESSEQKSTTPEIGSQEKDVRPDDTGFLYSTRITDQDTLDFLDNQKHVTVYRAMQEIDGKLYPPMTAYTIDENGKKIMRPAAEIGSWYQSVERPDLIDPKTGKFKLEKGATDAGKGSAVNAAYNPYFHTSLSILNDQFSSAWDRSNLVVVEGEVPVSELTSGYKAQYAKDAVGKTKWHSGPVATELNKIGKPREVILSRYFKPTRVIGNDEAARSIADTLKGTKISIPENVVSPRLLDELKKFGVNVSAPKGLSQDQINSHYDRVNGPKFSNRDTADNFNDIYETMKDGRIRPRSVEDLSTEDWKIIYQVTKKLGYGIKSAAEAKEVYGKYVGQNGFNKEQSEALKAAYGITEGEKPVENPARAAAAKKEYGVTYNFTEAGYMLRDGSLLDFSGKKEGGPSNVRYMDHREIARVFDTSKADSYSAGTEFMNQFINEGNIRLQDGIGVDLGEMEPSPKQYSQLKKFIDRQLNQYGSFFLDLSNRSGGMIDGREYVAPESSAKIINEIKEYYKTGELPYRAEDADYEYSLRDPNATDPRTLLSNALLDTAQNDTERKFIADYQDKIQQMNEEQRRLNEVRSEIKDLSFAKGPRDTAHINDLRAEANRLANRINTFDKQLLRIESMKGMKAVVDREKAKVKARVEKQSAENLAAYKQQVQQRHDAEIEKYRERVRKVRAEGWERLDKRVGEVRAEAAERMDRYKEKMSASEYIEKISKEVKGLRDRLLHPSAKTIIPESFARPVAEFLSAIDFGTYYADGTRRSGKANVTREQLRQRLETLADSIDQNALETEYGQLDFDPMMVDWIKNTVTYLNNNFSADDTYVLRKMSTEQLKELDKIVTNLRVAVNNAGRMYTNMAASIGSLGADTIDYLAPMYNRTRTLLGARAFKMLGWDYAQPVTVFDRFGSAGKTLFSGLLTGQRKEANNVQTILNFTENAYTREEINDWREEMHNVTINGTDYQIPASYIMEIYCMMKDADARRHIVEGGGIRFDDLTYGRPGRRRTRTFDNTMITEDEVNAMIGTLTDRQKEVADQMQEFMDRIGADWGNEISMRRFGYHAFGQIQNYYPIKTIKQGSEYEAQQKRANIYALLNKSFTKERVDNANNTVIIGDMFRTFSDHMSEMAIYNAWALPVIDTIKWFNYREAQDLDAGTPERSVKDALRKAFGADRSNPADEYIRRLLESINGQKSGGLSESWFFNGLRLVNRVAVAGNIRVAVQQPFSITRAFELINPRFVRPMTRATYNAEQQEMLDRSSFGRWKDLGYFDVDVSMPLQREILKTETIADRFTERTMVLAELGDQFTWTTLWHACKLEAQSRGLTGENAVNYAANRFDDLIARTQVVDSVLTKSQWMRSDSFMHRMTSAFMSEPMTSYNALLRQYDQFQRDRAEHGRQYAVSHNGRNIMRAVMVFTLTQAVNALVTAPIDASRDDDDYKTWLEKMLEKMKENFIENIIPTNMMPFWNNVTDYALYQSVNRSDLAIYTRAIDLAKDIYSIVSGENTKVKKIHKAFMSGLNAISSISGLPMSNMMRDAIAIWNTVVGDILPQFGVDTDYGAWKFQTAEDVTKVGYEQFVKAIRNNNPERAAYIYGQMLSNGLDNSGKLDDNIMNYFRKNVSADLTEEENAEVMTKMQTIMGIEDAEEQSEEKAAWWAYSGEHPDSFLAERSAFKSYYEKIYPYGIDADTYSDYREKLDNTTGIDLNGDGKADNGTKLTAIAQLIDSYDLTDAQKDVLFQREYPDSDLSKMPWHQSEKGEASTIAMSLTRKEYDTYLSLKDKGIEIGVYAGFLDAVKNATGTDYNGDGKADNGTKQAEIAQYIDSLPLTNAQKDTLFLTEFEMKDLNNQPWNTSADSATVDQHGIDRKTWTDYNNFLKTAKGIDNDGDGKADKSKQEIVIEYINSLPLTAEQKDAMYLEAYTPANIDKTPWHKK